MAAQMESLSEQTQSMMGTGPRSLIQERCLRCGGLMVAERYIDLLDDTGQIEFTADRCIQCGEVVDPIILNNRMVNQRRADASRLAKVA